MKMEFKNYIFLVTEKHLSITWQRGKCFDNLLRLIDETNDYLQVAPSVHRSVGTDGETAFCKGLNSEQNPGNEYIKIVFLMNWHGVFYQVYTVWIFSYHFASLEF